jgi:hypothetical protein
MNEKSTNNQAGKGDKPRNCFSEQYRNNYESINWSKKTNSDNGPGCLFDYYALKEYIEPIKHEP